MPLRTAAFFGAVCLSLGWLLASLLTPPIALVQGLPGRQGVAPPSVEVPAPLAEQLNFRLRQAPIAPSPRRNPFIFGTRTRSAGQTSAPRVVAAQVDMPTPPPAVVGPAFSLSGIGVRETPSGLVHTAVLSDGRTVHLLNAGDTIGGYRVVEVTETSATLADASGARYLLRLR